MFKCEQYRVGICGYGFVGTALYNSFTAKDIHVDIYDKFIERFNHITNILHCDIVFLCLPTKFDSNINSYDKTALYDVCEYLDQSKYTGSVVIKSTIEPGTTDHLSNKYNLSFIHNPEFLTARTASEDYNNQTHIVLGRGTTCTDELYNHTIQFHKVNYPEAEISSCTSLESESMKLFANCFYSVKVQFFTELYLLCEKIQIDYDQIKDLMLKNNWINPMHTQIPGPDGKISYGGLCFPKDTSALLNYMKRYNSAHMVLESVIEERNIMRDDQANCI